MKNATAIRAHYDAIVIVAFLVALFVPRMIGMIFLVLGMIIFVISMVIVTFFSMLMTIVLMMFIMVVIVISGFFRARRSQCKCHRSKESGKTW